MNKPTKTRCSLGAELVNDESTYSVLLVEDDAPTRERLAGIIAAHSGLDLLPTCGNLAQGMEELYVHTPDVLLTDLGLPDGHGVELIRAARHKDVRIEIMVISVFGDEHNVINAIEAGATGYLLKDGDSRYIGESIMELVAGGSPITPSIARHLLKRFSTAPPTEVPKDSTTPSLTKRETDVLKAVAKGFTYTEIADVLSMSPHTVTSHIKNIYRKLEVCSRSEAVFEAVQLGLIDMRSS
jgi:DNA-binding NarL/FixJ family response regulator